MHRVESMAAKGKLRRVRFPDHDGPGIAHARHEQIVLFCDLVRKGRGPHTCREPLRIGHVLHANRQARQGTTAGRDVSGARLRHQCIAIFHRHGQRSKHRSFFRSAPASRASTLRRSPARLQDGRVIQPPQAPVCRSYHISLSFWRVAGFLLAENIPGESPLAAMGAAPPIGPRSPRFRRPHASAHRSRRRPSPC